MILAFILAGILAQHPVRVGYGTLRFSFSDGPSYPAPAFPYTLVSPYQVDTRAQTAGVFAAAACTLPVPNNCLASCGLAGGAVVCGNSVVLDANGVWGIHP